MEIIYGIFFHAMGGLAAGSFYLPYKKIEGWSWEVYWILGGLFSWIVAPWVAAWLTVPALIEVFRLANWSDLFMPFAFGMLWGIGGLTFGLTMRYLGLSLGYALALGLTAIFGTLIPPLFDGKFLKLLQSNDGLILLAGIGICALGIALTGRAGILRDRQMVSKENQSNTFDLKKGSMFAILAGIMSACFAFGIASGNPIAQLAKEMDTPVSYVNNPVFICIMFGGFITNFVYCGYKLAKNASWKEYFSHTPKMSLNFVLSISGGLIWYMQFFFYGIGTTKMQDMDFASWTIHMAFIIVFSNCWGLYLKEWKEANKNTMTNLYLGLLMLILSTVVIGLAVVI